MDAMTNSKNDKAADNQVRPRRLSETSIVLLLALFGCLLMTFFAVYLAP